MTGPATPLPPAAVRLRGAGLRATRQRTAVMSWLDDHPGHHPAEVMVTDTGLPKATVYHVLGQLTEVGLVLAAEAGAGRVLYESGGVPHHHFVCRACGRLVDVPCVTGEAPCIEVAVPGAEVDQADVILRGTCQACLAAA